MKEFLRATYHLFLFKPYTDMSRLTEIALGLLAWLNLIMLIILIIK